jgi:hypothetical protein
MMMRLMRTDAAKSSMMMKGIARSIEIEASLRAQESALRRAVPGKWGACAPVYGRQADSASPCVDSSR